MKTYAKQWRTLNTSWPEEGDLIDIVYEDGELSSVELNVLYSVDHYGNGSFTKNGVEYQDDYITGWRHVQE